MNPRSPPWWIKKTTMNDGLPPFFSSFSLTWPIKSHGDVFVKFLLIWPQYLEGSIAIIAWVDAWNLTSNEKPNKNAKYLLKNSSKVERDESYFGDEGNLYQPSTCSVCVWIISATLKKHSEVECLQTFSTEQLSKPLWHSLLLNGW